MKNEIKICLPIYKVIYSAAFILILSLVRGITRNGEIGIAIESPIALLTMIFCADTYLIEVQSKRQEVFYLYSLKNQTCVVLCRLMVQMIYLTVISIINYGLFYWQKPIVEFDGTSPLVTFLMFLIAIIGTICFWGTLSMTISNLFGNVLAGIGSVLFLWFGLVSKAGNQILGKWNVFSFTFRDIDKINDWSWMCGKTVSLVLAVILVIAIPFILKKRG